MTKNNLNIELQAEKILTNTAKHKFHHGFTDAKDELNLTDQQYQELYDLIKTAAIKVSWD